MNESPNAMVMRCMRPELGALPQYLRHLPLDDRGYPVPWFVAWVDGKPEFRAADVRKYQRAVKERLCWVCGMKLGRKLVFVIGPMCGINRVSSEPPSHEQCARWSAQNCPFLNFREKRRRENNLPEGTEEPAGISITRNPGVTLLWHTNAYELFPDGMGKQLIRIGEARYTEWFSRGRPATRAEVMHSIETGLPALEGLATTPAEKRALNEQMAEFYYSVELPPEPS